MNFVTNTIAVRQSINHQETNLEMLAADDSMSNLTSGVSNEASTNIINEMGSRSSTLYSYHHHLPITSQNNNEKQQQPPAKKKRNLPGNPDPEAEVVALSPRALMATNRFVCEICNKGFQRDQNLQLHRRGHNLPWKLKQRSNKDVVKKKVYICPEPSCVHHDPSRALGDLTGIKKHFSRKHGEKKWKCDKCSKRYAVQSDWKAHSKICGTREYRCDCGTLFSRRDSFITHRAFCDALAQESSRSLVGISPQIGTTQTAPNQIHGFNHSYIPLKQETQTFNGGGSGGLPPWLSSSDQPVSSGPSAGGPPMNSLFTRLDQGIQHNTNPNFLPTLISSASSSSSTATASHSLMSATALLQKAAQMGVTMSSKMAGHPTSSSEQSILIRPHHDHMAAGSSPAAVVLPTRDEMATGFLQYDHLPASFDGNNKLGGLPSACNIMELQDHISASMDAASLPSTGGFDGSTLSFEGGFHAMMNQKLSESGHLMSAARKGDSGGGDGLTRDFLGLRAFPHRSNFADIAGLDPMGGGGPSFYGQQANQYQVTWQH